MKDFDIFYSPPPEIREHKETKYTVTLIGGPEEYKQYLKDKAIRLAEKKRASDEAYLLKRSFLGEIVEGRALASPEANREAPTLKRYQWELGAPQPTLFAQEVPTPEAPALKVSWFRKIASRLGVKI